jgi:hypothetical protein
MERVYMFAVLFVACGEGKVHFTPQKCGQCGQCRVYDFEPHSSGSFWLPFVPPNTPSLAHTARCSVELPFFTTRYWDMLWMQPPPL